MENRDGNDKDRKGKRPLETSEFEQDVVWNRLPLEKWQTMILKAAYNISKYPSSEAMQELACMTALTPRQVKVWFKNKWFVQQFEKGESSNSKLQLPASEIITRDESVQDVERVIHTPVWQHDKLVSSGVLITYRRRHQQQPSMQQESRVMPVHENQSTDGTDNNVRADPVDAPTVPGDQEQGLIEQEHDSDSGSATETD